MTTFNRRSWIKTLSTASAGAVLLKPTDILSAIPPDIEERTNGQLIRLSSNENPYSPSDKMKEAIARINKDICRYPNSQFSKLENMIAERENIDPSMVVVTSGSREGLKAVGMLHSLKGGEILTCLPTYKALLTYAEFIGAQIRAVPLDKDLKFDLEGLLQNLNDDTKLAFVCNPNNPTGTLLDPHQLERFCRQASTRVPVFVDEVYYDYIEEAGYPSMKHLCEEGLDIMIARTFSKVYGLAGVRIGYMMAKPDIASRIRKSLMSGTNIMGVRMAMTALEDQSFRDFSLQKNREAKEMIYTVLNKKNINFVKSHTNFVFFETGKDISKIQEAYKKEGVIVGRAFPPYLDWCRISTGTLEEVKAFVSATDRVFT